MLKGKPVIQLLSVVVLVFGAVACSGEVSTPEGAVLPPMIGEPTVPSPDSSSTGGEAGGGASHAGYNTVFPLPDDVQNFAGEGGEGAVSFQTCLILEEVIDFYRHAFTEQDLIEREALTLIEDASFSIVFDGWPNGRAIVIQGVDMGETTNVNIRFEAI